MDKKELERKIHDKIEEIEKSLPTLKASAQPVSLDEPIGRLSRMDAIGAQAVNKRVYKANLEKLSQLRRALTEINNEDFGLCAECEEPIHFKRILAVPESPYCINCASKKE